MFRKEGIPFFTIIMPFLSILFIAFFATSYYLKLSDRNFEADLKEYKEIYLSKSNDRRTLNILIEKKKELHIKRQEEFKNFMSVLTKVVLFFMVLFLF